MIPCKFSGYINGMRLYFKGGDGGAAEMRADAAARDAQARADEDTRKAKIQAAVDAVNGTFANSNRQAMYNDVAGATKDVATRGLDQDFTKASRNNLFGLARSGQLGGSVDAEAGGELQRRYGEGKIRAEQAGMSAASDLQSADEKTRQNLISLSQSGIDSGTAASLAASQMAAAGSTAQANSGAATVGKLFDDLGQAYLTNQTLQAKYPNGLPAASSGFGSSLFNPNGYSGKVTA